MKEKAKHQEEAGRELDSFVMNEREFDVHPPGLDIPTVVVPSVVADSEMIKVQFKLDTPDTVTIRSGSYDRTFRRSLAPYEMHEKEYLLHLEPTKLFMRLE